MIAEATSDAPFSVVALLALVVLFGLALAWWQRTRGSLAGGDAIRLVSLRPLGGKRLLALVEVENERFLLGLTDERIACLARLAAGEDAQEPATPATREAPCADGAWLERRA